MDKNKKPPIPPINNGDLPAKGAPPADIGNTAASHSVAGAENVDSAGKGAAESSASTAPKAGQPVSPQIPAAGAGRADSAYVGKKEKTAPAVKRAGAGKTIAWLVIAIAIVAAGYFLWPHYGEQFKAVYLSGDSSARQQSGAGKPVVESSLGQLPETEQAIDPTVTLAFALEQESLARQALEEQLKGQIADLDVQLNSYNDRLRRLSTTSREDWLLAEAEYLLRLASQRILTERQTANALALMESADTILRDFNDTELFAVRRELANDITRVRMVAAVDREGIYLHLGALIDAVDQLDSLLPELPAPTQPVADGVDAVPLAWYQQLLDNARKALVKMAGLVRVERRNQPLEPLLTLGQEQTLRNNIKIVLEQTRLALLREEQGIYEASLDRAANWVRDNFEADAVATLFLEDIADLKQQSVVQQLPSLSGSIRALQEYIRLWHNRYESSANSSDKQERAGSSALTGTSREEKQ